MDFICKGVFELGIPRHGFAALYCDSNANLTSLPKPEPQKSEVTICSFEIFYGLQLSGMRPAAGRYIVLKFPRASAMDPAFDVSSPACYYSRGQVYMYKVSFLPLHNRDSLDSSSSHLPLLFNFKTPQSLVYLRITSVLPNPLSAKPFPSPTQNASNRTSNHPPHHSSLPRRTPSSRPPPKTPPRKAGSRIRDRLHILLLPPDRRPLSSLHPRSLVFCRCSCGIPSFA